VGNIVSWCSECYQSCCARGLFSVAAYEHLNMILYIFVATHEHSPSIFYMNVKYVIVILPLILYFDYVCNVCVMGIALLSDMMKIQITELVE
jgi:hypothetical protein